MKLYYFYTKEYEEMRNSFLSSLKDPFDVIGMEANYKKSEGSGGGISTWTYKAHFILDAMKDNQGETILVCDIDIVFFEKTEELIKKAIENKKIVFQKEHLSYGANIGFMAIFCDRETTQFWETVLQTIEREHVWDQVIVNRMIYDEKYPISWGTLPLEFYSFTLSGNLKFSSGENLVKTFIRRVLILLKSLLRNLKRGGNVAEDRLTIKKRLSLWPKTIVCYHANFAGHEKNAMRIKLRQLLSVQNYLKKRK